MAVCQRLFIFFDAVYKMVCHDIQWLFVLDLWSKDLSSPVSQHPLLVRIVIWLPWDAVFLYRDSFVINLYLVILQRVGKYKHLFVSNYCGAPYLAGVEPRDMHACHCPFPETAQGLPLSCQS